MRVIYGFGLILLAGCTKPTQRFVLTHDEQNAFDTKTGLMCKPYQDQKTDPGSCYTLYKSE